MQVDAIKQQLDIGNVVLLTNLAYSPAGEVLSCNIYDVATHAAIELDADKLICMTLKVGVVWQDTWQCQHWHNLTASNNPAFLISLGAKLLEQAQDELWVSGRSTIFSDH